MEQLKRSVIRLIPDVVWDYYRMYSYKKRGSSLFSGRPAADTFGEIHKSNFWQSKDSLSGTGSDLKQTDFVREALPRIMKKYGVASVMDIPCGDFNWMQYVDLRGIRYVGADIVPGLIDANTERFSSESVEFVRLDLLEDSLPQVDLVFCRDCLVHFSYYHIRCAIRNIVSSGSKYLLTTSFPKRRINFDIETGDWRPINLEIPPFDFPEPVEVVLENCTEGNGKCYDKSLLLYRVSELQDAVK
jgi:hypothetical protein